MGAQARLTEKNDAMHLFVRGGTNGTDIVLFWPDNLPADADESYQHEPLVFVDRMRSEGRLIRLPVGSLGHYSAALFLYSPVPEDLLANAELVEEIPNLIIQGIGYFGGMEFLFVKDRRLLDAFPQLCEEVSIPAGQYSARVYQTRITPELRDSWLIKRTGTDGKMLRTLQATLTSSVIIGMFMTFLSMYFWPISVWLTVFIFTAGLTVAAVSHSHSPIAQAVAQSKRDFEITYPSYLLILDKVAVIV